MLNLIETIKSRAKPYIRTYLSDPIVIEQNLVYFEQIIDQ